MTKSVIAGLLFASLLGALPAQAQTKEPATPPEKSLKLSEIIAKIEKRDQFRYISEIEWESEGYYDVVYYTFDKARVEIKIDPVSGEPRL